MNRKAMIALLTTYYTTTNKKINFMEYSNLELQKVIRLFELK
jgi:hypothetical protein